jgi:hypothetical protein
MGDPASPIIGTLSQHLPIAANRDRLAGDGFAARAAALIGRTALV